MRYRACEEENGRKVEVDLFASSSSYAGGIHSPYRTTRGSIATLHSTLKGQLDLSPVPLLLISPSSSTRRQHKMEEGQEQHPSPEDLLAPDDIQNRLIDAILADELAEVLVWTRLLEQWGKQGLIGERSTYPLYISPKRVRVSRASRADSLLPPRWAMLSGSSGCGSAKPARWSGTAQRNS